MNGSDVQFSPKDGFLVTHADYYNDAQNKYLVYLYQPILGPVAAALYTTLKSLENPDLMRTQRPLHRVLLDTLGVDLVAVETARRRLEALSLLRTYTAEDMMGRYFVYELYAPLDPSNFFHEDLLSLLLYQTVGTQRFDQIKAQFQLHPVTKDLKEITVPFASIFPNAVKDAVTDADRIQETKANFQIKDRTPTSFSTREIQSFDWALLQDLLQRYQIPKTELTKNQQMIYELHRFYGIDEVAMANLITSTLDIVTNEINPRKLESLALQEYTQTKGSVKSTTVKAKTVENDTSASKAAQTYSDDEQRLLRQAKALSVTDFLAWQKQLKKGFVGKGETRVLRELQHRNIFSDALINMLTYANLIESSTVTLAFIENVANDWQQNDIQTPEAALKRIQAHYQTNGRTNQAVNGKRYSRTPKAKQITEPIPAWYQESQSSELSEESTNTQNKGKHTPSATKSASQDDLKFDKLFDQLNDIKQRREKREKS
ncbi:DnaD domain protein [Agrilactobacillus fermenti]|uniref:DnaD domain protein n=1 Tax=Agrilactobacillus fermenti TaxID=2586909 RepID=UPI001E5C8C08|nr:DnaD domain protein [Agrilactobacillus fermenti]MCD2256661.1 DnaD domain protein [Agrilactobacillus fermenti]